MTITRDLAVERWQDKKRERIDTQTCSQTCRTRVYRQRKQRALALHAEGKTMRAIARELDAKVDAVTKWITTGE